MRPPPEQTIETVVIIGVGLIGGSIAAGLKARGFTGRIVGVGRNQKRLQVAESAGLIDCSTVELKEAAGQASLLIFCTPVDRIVEGVRTAAANCQPGTLLTDTGSVKGSICRDLANGLPEKVTFIGSHPLAGSEKRGFEHAQPDLFQARVTVVTPDASTPGQELARLKRFWQSLGSTVIEMSAAEHDRVLALTSHLPHVAAAALVEMLPAATRPFAASGFCDTTRIASGDPDLWCGILVENADEITNKIDTYIEKLTEFRACLTGRDHAGLNNLLEVAKTNRDSLLNAPGADNQNHPPQADG